MKSLFKLTFLSFFMTNYTLSAGPAATTPLSFEVEMYGEEHDDTVILLHGFPQTNAIWKPFQKLLSKYNYKSIAPNLRGVSQNAIPKDINQYKLELMARDIIQIADENKIENFHLIGHDIGSAVAQFVSYHYPNRIKSLTLLSTAHLKSLSAAVKDDKKQFKAISYMRRLKLPFIPEIVFKWNNYDYLKNIWEVTPQKIQNEMLQTFKKPNVLTGAINFYRANYKDLINGNFNLGKISVPTLFLWGKKEKFLLESSLEKNSYYFIGEYTEKRMDLGHWLIEEDFKTTSQEIINHLNHN